MPDFQLSLAIGKEGQNARLAHRLTGWRIDIKSETQLAEELSAPAEDYESDDWAQGAWIEDPETGEQKWQPADGSPAMTLEEYNALAEGSTETVAAPKPPNPKAPSDVPEAQPEETDDEVREVPAPPMPPTRFRKLQPEVATTRLGRCRRLRCADGDVADRTAGGHRRRDDLGRTRRWVSASPVRPQRTCVGCRARMPSSAMRRVTFDRDGASLTVGGPSAGRGAWICSDECLQRAIDGGGLHRALRR